MARLSFPSVRSCSVDVGLRAHLLSSHLLDAHEIEAEVGDAIQETGELGLVDDADDRRLARSHLDLHSLERTRRCRTELSRDDDLVARGHRAYVLPPSGAVGSWAAGSPG